MINELKTAAKTLDTAIDQIRDATARAAATKDDDFEKTLRRTIAFGEQVRGIQREMNSFIAEKAPKSPPEKK